MKKLTAEDMETKSPDVVSNNIEHLKAIFPEAFTEGKVNFDVLKQLLGGAIDEREEKYGLNWHGKRRARQLALTPSAGTLRPCPEDSVDWDTTQNLMIEGDNLEVLKLLQKSYAGKVKLIYIDPPYNTGKDFVYPDNFQDNIRNYLELTGQVDGEGRKLNSNTEASGRFHTDWLNMMYPRLKLARDMLAPEGILCASIDEHELSSLIDLCDEVFGYENRIGQVTVVNNLKGRSDDAFLATCHESLVMYAKDVTLAELVGLPLPAQMADEYDLEDNWGRYKLIPLKKSGKGWRRTDRPNMYYPIYVSDDCSRISLSHFAGSTAVFPVKGQDDARWRWGQETFRARADRDVVVRRVRSGALTVFSKMRLGEEGQERTIKAKTTWIDPKFDSAAGGRDIASLDLAELFENPKPVAFVQELLTIATDDDALVMDFFAGSGTTGHGVMAQNAADGGDRRYVLVQLPERLDPDNREQKTAAAYCDKLNKPGTIAELTKERLRRAGKKLRKKNSMFAGDLGFRVFKLASSNIQAWEPDRDNLAETLEASIEHLKTDRTEQDILFELLLKLGLDLCVPIETKKVEGAKKQAHELHSIGGGSLLVCLSPAIRQADVEPLALGLVAWHQALKPAGDTTVVFRDSAFADDVAKTNLTAILQQHGLEKVSSL